MMNVKLRETAASAAQTAENNDNSSDRLEREKDGNTMGQRGIRLKSLLLIAGTAASISLLGGCGLGSGAGRQELRLSGIEKLDAGDYAGAIADLEEALNLGKGRVGEIEFDILKYRAEAEVKIGDYSAAAHTYGILMEVDGEKPEYTELRCMLNARAGNTDQAMEDYKKLYQAYKAPGDGTDQAEEAGQDKGIPLTKLIKDIGKTLKSQGKEPEALTFYEQAEADGLADSEIYNQMGLCYLEKGEYIKAGQAFEKGISAPDQAAAADLAFNRAVALEYQRDYAGALKAFESYVSQYGSDDRAEHEIAFLKTR